MRGKKGKRVKEKGLLARKENEKWEKEGKGSEEKREGRLEGRVKSTVRWNVRGGRGGKKTQ